MSCPETRRGMLQMHFSTQYQWIGHIIKEITWLWNVEFLSDLCFLQESSGAALKETYKHKIYLEEKD